jgi:hypothetical protein
MGIMRDDKVQIMPLLPLLSVEAGQDACQARRLAFGICGYVLTFTLGYCEKEYLINCYMHCYFQFTFRFFDP